MKEVDIDHLRAIQGLVFHGSPARLKTLLPLQAKTRDRITGQLVNDGELGISATPFLDIAIFRAIINRTNCSNNYASNFGIDNGEVFFKASKEALSEVKRNNTHGFVYAFSENDFKFYSPKEVRASVSLKPDFVTQVSIKDLPENIEILYPIH